MTGPLRLGIDLGTSAVKAIVLDETGAPVAEGEAPFDTVAVEPGQAEQDTGGWLTAAYAAVAVLRLRLDGDWRHRIASIGLAGQLPTLVCLGEEGPLGPAITWRDARADAWAAEHMTEDRRAAIYCRTGMPIDGRYLAPMYRFHWHERRGPIRHILSAKDYLCYALTGHAVTDPSTAAGYGVYALEEGFDPALCALWDLDPALLPRVQPAEAVAGVLSPAGAQALGLPAGLPVGVGTADSAAGALAATGVTLEEGVVSLLSGSSTIVIDAVRAPHLDPRRRYLLTPHARSGWFGREMDLLATGTGHRWLGRILGCSDQEIWSHAAASVPGARGLFFAPYLAGGEQGALWDPNLSGVLHGLRLHHGPGELTRAFLEGVQFEIRRCVDVLAETRPVRRVVVAGPMAASAFGVQMLADILGRPVIPFPHRSPAALGAALLAPGARGCAVSGIGDGVAPGPAAEVYTELYHRYRALFPRLAGQHQEEMRWS
jgi:sugar (pentulose or hexulose) kinase